MRILIVADSISKDSGGGRTGILSFLRAISLFSESTTLFLNSDSKLSKRIISFKKFNIVYRNCHKYNLFKFFGIYKFIYMELDSFDAVLLHSPYKIHNYIISFYCLLISKPIIYRPHGSFDINIVRRKNKYIKYFLIFTLEKLLIINSKIILLSSYFELNNFSLFFNIKNCKIVPEAIEQFLPENIDPRFQLKRALYLGRLSPQKGLDRLIISLNGLPNVGFTVLIAGTGDVNYVRYLQNLSTNPKVIFLGYVNDQLKRNLLISSDLFILTSLGENFGLSVLEAMSCGLPLLLSNKVGMAENPAILNCGVVINPDVDSITNALINFDKNLYDLNNFSINSYTLFQTSYTINTLSLNLKNIFNNLNHE